jgi:hypothetical protein
MSNKNTGQVFILCEDSVHYHFIRKYLELLSFNSRNIKGCFNPKGRSVGSGAQSVQDNYKKQLQAFRSKVNKNKSERLTLVVMIDDDTKDRIKKLYEIDEPTKSERVLIFSPKRNIESWFHYIDGNNINESDDYKKIYRNAKPTEFAKKLKEKVCVRGLPENAPSSLHHTCRELARLDFSNHR